MVAIYVAVKSSKNEPNTTKKVDIVHSITVAEVNNLPGKAIMVNRTEHTCVGMGCSDNSRIKIIVKDGNGILHSYDLGGDEGELFLNAKVGDNLKNPNW